MQPERNEKLKQIFSESQTRASSYLWRLAAQRLVEALDLSEVRRDPRLEGSVWEELCDCTFKAAFQCTNRADFLQTVRTSREASEKAAQSFDLAGARLDLARVRSKRLRTVFWEQSGADEKRDTIHKSVELLGEALLGHGRPGSLAEFSRTNLELLYSIMLALDLAAEGKQTRILFEQASKIVRETIEYDNHLNDQTRLDVFHYAVYLFAVRAQTVLSATEFEILGKETRALATSLDNLSRKMGTEYALCLAKEALGDVSFNLDGNYIEADRLYGEAVAHAKKTDDVILVGRLLWRLSTVEAWKAEGESQIAQRRKSLKEAFEKSLQAIKSLEVPFHTTYLTATHGSGSMCLIDLAFSVETDITKKKEYLTRAVTVAKEGTRIERGTWAALYNLLSLSRALMCLGSIEDNREEKSRVLSEALALSSELVKLTDELVPNSWNRGLEWHRLAAIRSELADLQPNHVLKLQMISQSTSEMRKGLDLSIQWANSSGLRLSFAKETETYGDTTYKLYRASKDPLHAENSISAYKEALSIFSALNDLPSLGRLSWKIARLLDNMGDLEGARDEFREAAKRFSDVASKMLGLRSTFDELANYMRAWVFIEEARLQHVREEYEQAIGSYESAGNTLRRTRRWIYAAELCHARSTRERGELLSIEEDHSRSRECFTQAAKGFSTGRELIQQTLNLSFNPNERLELQDWLKAASQQENYSSARAILEEARDFDIKGEKAESSKKFLLSAQLLRELIPATENSADREELESLVGFCSAWGEMKEAESKVSPEAFQEASKSFLQIAQKSNRTQTQILAKANSSICEALSAGTRFLQSRNVDHYSNIKKQLEIAADLFREAGFTRTESWTRATERLFDSLVFLSDAESERDPKKKAELYVLAEKHLELTARLYSNAGFPSRRREALAHLERAREEKEILHASLNALSQIPIASGAAIRPLGLGRAQPLGVERFEGASVAADLNLPVDKVVLGSELILDVDIANVGAENATLVKIEDLSSKGLKINPERTPHPVADEHIDLEGKRLGHLKTSKVKISLTAIKHGTFELQPRIFFVDDRGNYMSYGLRPARVTVLDQEHESTDLSQLETIPPRITIPEEFHFETQRAKEVFEVLANAFVKDYISKKLHVDNSGWRSLLSIIHESRIPRSSLYGPTGRVGPILAELEHRRLVEVRIFPGERGRGGAVKRIRIAYDNIVVKEFIMKMLLQK